MKLKKLSSILNEEEKVLIKYFLKDTQNQSLTAVQVKH